MEYHLRQLADVCPAGVVLYHLDDAGPAALRHAVRPVPGRVRHRAARAGLRERPAAESGRAVPRAAPGGDHGLRPGQLPPGALCPLGSQGEAEKRLKGRFTFVYPPFLF